MNRILCLIMCLLAFVSFTSAASSIIVIWNTGITSELNARVGDTIYFYTFDGKTRTVNIDGSSNPISGSVDSPGVFKYTIKSTGALNVGSDDSSISAKFNVLNSNTVPSTGSSSTGGGGTTTSSASTTTGSSGLPTSTSSSSTSSTSSTSVNTGSSTTASTATGSSGLPTSTSSSTTSSPSTTSTLSTSSASTTTGSSGLPSSSTTTTTTSPPTTSSLSSTTTSGTTTSKPTITTTTTGTPSTSGTTTSKPTTTTTTTGAPATSGTTTGTPATTSGTTTGKPSTTGSTTGGESSTSGGKTCSIKITQTKKSSWKNNGNDITQYEVVIENQGDMAITDLIKFTFTDSDKITDLWELTKVANGEYILPAWRVHQPLLKGDTHKFGYITKGPQSKITASGCQSQQASVTSGASTGDKSTNPAVGGTSTGVETTATTGGCHATFTQTMSNQWESGGKKFTHVNVLVENTGTKEVIGLNFAIDAPISQIWSVVKGETNVYTFPAHVKSLPPIEGKFQFGYIVEAPEIADITKVQLTC